MGMLECDNVSTSIAHEIRGLIYPSLSQYVNISQIKLRENEKCVITVEIDATPYCSGIKEKQVTMKRLTSFL